MVGVGDAGTVRVSIEPAACNGCGKEGSCVMPGGTSRPLIVDAVNNAHAVEGDCVLMAYSHKAHLKYACLLYLVPSITITLGAVVGHEWLAVILGILPEAGGLLGAILFLFAGLAPAISVARTPSALPVVVKVIEEG